MKKLMFFAAVITSLALLFTGCPDGNGNGEGPDTYTVTFHSTMQELYPDPESQIVEHGQRATKPADPEDLPEGIDFLGWFFDPEPDFDNEDPFDFETPITSAIILYAVFEIDEDLYNIVRFYYMENMMDADFTLYTTEVLPKSDEGPIDEPVITNLAVYREFVGWFKDETFTDEWDFEDDVTESFDLYAKIIFIGEDPEVVGNQIVHNNPLLAIYFDEDITAEEAGVEVCEFTGIAYLENKAGKSYGFYYGFPEDWEDYKEIVIDYAITVTAGPAKITIKDGAGSFSDILTPIYHDTTHNALTGSWTIATHRFPRSESIFENPGVSFQHNNHQDNGARKFSVRITKITFTEATSADNFTPTPAPTLGADEVAHNNPEVASVGNAIINKFSGNVILAGEAQGLTYNFPAGWEPYLSVKVDYTATIFKQYQDKVFSVDVFEKGIDIPIVSEDLVADDQQSNSGSFLVNIDEFATGGLTLMFAEEAGVLRITSVTFFKDEVELFVPGLYDPDTGIHLNPAISGLGGADVNTINGAVTLSGGDHRWAYKFPDELDKNEFNTITIHYELLDSNGTPEGNIKNSYSGWIDIAAGGSGQYPALQASGTLWYPLYLLTDGINSQRNGTGTTHYTIKITQIVFSFDEANEPDPGDGEDDLVLTEWNDIAFEGWGGLGSIGKNTTFNMLASAEWGNMMTYNLPSQANNYEKITISFTLTKLTSGNDTLPMKLVVKNGVKDNWGAPDFTYPQSNTNGSFTFTRDIAEITSGSITFGMNWGEARNESADFTIVITEIKFTGFKGDGGDVYTPNPIVPGADYTLKLTGLTVKNATPTANNYANIWFDVSAAYPAEFNITDYAKITIRAKYFDVDDKEIYLTGGLGQIRFATTEWGNPDGENYLGAMISHLGIAGETVNIDRPETLSATPTWLYVQNLQAAVRYIEITEITFHVAVAAPPAKTLADFVTITGDIPGINLAVTLKEGLIGDSGLLSGYNWNGRRPIWLRAVDNSMYLKLHNEGNDGLVIKYGFEEGDKITIKGRTGDITGEFVLNPDGDWAPLIQQNLTAGQTFNVTGTFNAVQAARNEVRFNANNNPPGTHFFIDSVEIERPGPLCTDCGASPCICVEILATTETYVYAINTIQINIDVKSPITNPAVTWGVFSDSTATTVSTLASIDSDGKLTAAKTAGTVWIVATSVENTAKKSAPFQVTIRPSPVLVRRAVGTPGGGVTYNSETGYLTISSTTNNITGATPSYNMVFVKEATTAGTFDAEVDIVRASSSLPSNANALMGIAVLGSANPSTETDPMIWGYQMNAQRENFNTRMPYNTYKLAGIGNNHNGGSEQSSLDVPDEADFTLGIKFNTNAAQFNRSIYTQTIAGVLKTQAIGSDRVIFANINSDAYIGLIVSAGTAPGTTMVISELRVKPAGETKMIKVDLSQTLEVYTAP